MTTSIRVLLQAANADPPRMTSTAEEMTGTGYTMTKRSTMATYILSAMALAVFGVVVSASLLAADPKMASKPVTIDPMQLMQSAADMPVVEIAEPL